MSDHRQPDGCLIQTFSGCRTPDPASVLEAGMFSDKRFSSRRAAREKLPDPRRKTVDIQLIQFHPALSFPLSAASSRLAVAQTLRFGLLQSLRFDQESLPFVPFACLAPLQDDSRQG
jgi:hypothetical protein